MGYKKIKKNEFFVLTSGAEQSITAFTDAMLKRRTAAAENGRLY